MLWFMADADMPEFSSYLRELRTVRGLSQRALGAKARVEPSTIARWENGAVPTRSDSRETVMRVSKALDDDDRLLQLAGHLPRPDEPKTTTRRPPMRDLILSEKTLPFAWQRRALLGVYEELLSASAEDSPS